MVLAAFAVAVLILCEQFSQAEKTANDEQMLQQRNYQWLKAFDVKDDATLDKIETGDFDILSEAGVWTKKNQLEGVRASKNDVFPINRTIENQKVRLYGDTAVITELDHAAGSGGSSSYETSSVWVRHSTEWKIVHLHFTKVEDSCCKKN
jgi:ketosteroid isomerase-like protein